MPGDITRFTFDPAKGYSSVREQQGRLRSDADHNEQVDLALHDERTTRTDVIGPSGAPIGDAGMAITVVGGTIHVGAGRYYVDGIRCEHRPTAGSSVTFPSQPYVPGAALPGAQGVYVAYLDVWERPITAVQDPSIREVALGGPDTTTRTQVVWQVKLLPIANPPAAPTCGSVFPEWTALLAPRAARLEVRVSPAGTNVDPCIVPEAAGFRGVENQTYRIAVHDTVQAAGPRFKWSRDNGSVVATVLAQPAANEVEVDRLGPGGAEGFELGGWVELTDDHDALLERAGRLGQINDIEERMRLVLGLDGVYALAADRHAQARRWDSPGAVTFTTGAWIPLEDGIEVRFSGTGFRSGDAWIVPARTAILPGTLDRQIEWPHDAGGNPIPVAPFEVRHHYAKLAVVRLDAGGWSVLSDCRVQFPELGDMLAFEGRGGDGQHAPSGHFLPAPLIVGVARGRHPQAGARVRFSLVADVTAGIRGGLSPTEPSTVGVAPTAATHDVVTGADGLARIWWQLGDAPSPEVLVDRYQSAAAQVVEARLLDDTGTPQHLAQRFVAIANDDLVMVATGGDGQSGLPGQVLPVALRVRVSRGSRPLAGALVRFFVMDTMLNGAPLDQFTGGSIHASSNVIAFDPWPGGSRMQRATVTTDAAGVAQVQWILGTDARLPTQRVTAVLLDAAGNETAQSTLFIGQIYSEAALTVEATVLPGNAVLTENLRLGLSSIEQLRFRVTPPLAFGTDLRVLVEALVPISMSGASIVVGGSATAVRPTMRVALTGTLAAAGPVATWSLTGADRQLVQSALAVIASNRSMTMLARVEPVADVQGRASLVPWLRSFRLAGTVPVVPIDPIGPIGPLEPIGPIGPLEPIGPVGPVGPGRPGGPGRPT